MLTVRYIDHHGHVQVFDIQDGETYEIKAVSVCGLDTDDKTMYLPNDFDKVKINGRRNTRNKIILAKIEFNL